MTKETKIMTVREAIKEAMTHEMREDENVFLMGEDVGIFGGDFGTTVGMLEEFGSERVIDTPISEAAICGAAAGAASVGMRPIVDVTFMDFVTIGMDAIVNQAAPMRYMLGGEVQVPVTYRCASGSGTGAAAQHCKALEAWFCHIPGLKVVAPGTAGDVYSILRAAIRDNNPVIYIEPKALFGRKGEVELGKVGVIGKGDIKAEGTDVTLVSWGRMLERSLQAAEELKQEFDKLIGEVEAAHPYLESIRASELTQRYINIEDLKIQSEKRDNKIYVGMENYREPFYMTVRIRNNSIKNISSGTFKEIYDTEDSKIYLLHVENPDLIITLGEENE